METIEVVEITIHDSTPSGDGVTAVLAASAAVVAQQGAVLADLAFGNQVSSTALAARTQVANQDAQNRLRHAILARAVASVQAPGPTTARSAVFVFSANELAQDVADLKASVQALAAPARKGADHG
jgi:hypothetical protein